jgi:hypothetical protein
MSTNIIPLSLPVSLHGFIDNFKRRIPPLHPLGEVTIHEWLSEMQFAADIGATKEVVRLFKLVRDKIQLELHWEAEDWETGNAYREAYQVRRQADRIAGVSSDWQIEWARRINAASAARAAERAEWTRKEIAKYGHVRTLEEYLAEKHALRANNVAQQEQTL